jgi:hypothetical protein
MQRQPRPGSELSNECQAESNGKKLLALERSASMWQTATMVVSIVAQLGILIFSIYSITEYHVPYLLLVVQLIETIVQAVEFAWYLGVVLYANCGKPRSVGVEVRYWDWAITTPTMLISLYLLIIYFEDNCASGEHIVDSWLLGVIPIIIADWMMLQVGYALEFDSSSYIKYLETVIVAQNCDLVISSETVPSKPPSILDGLATWFVTAGAKLAYYPLSCLPFADVPPRERGVIPSTARWPRRARSTLIFVGFLYLLAAFISHFVALSHRYSHEGLFLILLTLVVWMLYGLVSLFCAHTALEPVDKDLVEKYVSANTKQMWKNVFYNLLDLVSKNSTGLIVSIIAEAYHRDHKGIVHCTVPPPSPPLNPHPPFSPPPPF